MNLDVVLRRGVSPGWFLTKNPGSVSLCYRENPNVDPWFVGLILPAGLYLCPFGGRDSGIPVERSGRIHLVKRL